MTEMSKSNLPLTMHPIIQTTKARLVHIVFAGLTVTMIYVFGLSGGSLVKLFVAQMLFVLWVAMSVVLTHKKVVLNKDLIVILLVLAAVIASNIFVNRGNYANMDADIFFAITHAIGVLLFAFAAIWASSNLHVPYILKCLSWLLLPIILIAMAVGLSQDEVGRATPFGVHPNWWGEVAFGFILCSLALSRTVIRLVFVFLGLALMYMVQSRGALLAALVAVATYWFMQHRPLTKKAARNLALFGIVTIVGSVFVISSGIWIPIFDFVVSQVLFLDDPYRGIDSDFSNRIVNFLEAIAIFAENPIFGQGFDTLPKVHNGFLRWAGEGGILLLGLMTVLMTSAMIRAWRHHDNWAFAALLGISAYLLTYPRALNLNLVGLLFFLALFSRRESRSRSGQGQPILGSGPQRGTAELLG